MPSSPLRVNLNVTDAAGSDFVPLFNEGMQTVTIPRNHTSTYHDVPTETDGIDEPSGPVTVTVAGGSGYRLGAAATATITVNDDDEPGPEGQVQFSRETFIIAEFGPQYRAVVEIADGARTAGYDRIVNYTVGGSAERGDGKDYTIDGCSSSTCSVELRANSHSVAIDFNINTDSIDEGDETIVLTLQDGSGYTLNDKNTLTMTLIDDDTRGLDFRRRWAYVDEGGSGTYTVKLASQPTAVVTVNIDSDNPDVTVSPTSLTFNPTGNTDLWSRAQTVTVSVAPDNDAVDDTATLTHTTSGGDYGGDNALSIGRPVIVEDDDTGTTVTPQLPRISLTGGAAVTEGGDASFTVNADPAPTSSLTVSVEVIEPPGQDFVAASEERVRTVTLNAGATSTTFTVPTVDDSTDEDDGDVQAYVNPGTGYEDGQGAAVTVRDDDNPADTPVITVTAGAAVTEGSPASFTVNADRAPTALLTVNLRVIEPVGQDFVAANQEGVRTVTLGVGATSTTFTVPTMNDNTREEDGYVTVFVNDGAGYVAGSRTAVDVTVRDNDDTSQLTASFASGFSSAAESAGTHDVTVDLSRAAPSGGLTLSYDVSGTASGSDFTIQNSGTLTVGAGANFADIPVAINDDGSAESAETVVLTLTDGTGYTLVSPTVHTLTVNDNDGPAQPTASFASGRSRADESGGTHNVTVKLSPAAPSGGLTINYSVAGTATAGIRNDFTITNSGSVIIAAEATSATIPIDVKDDTIEDDGETVVLTLVAGTGYAVGSPSVHTLTIANTEEPVVSFGPATTPPEGGVFVSVTEGEDRIRDRADQVEPRAGVRHHDRLQR